MDFSADPEETTLVVPLHEQNASRPLIIRSGTAIAISKASDPIRTSPSIPKKRLSSFLSTNKMTLGLLIIRSGTAIAISKASDPIRTSPSIPKKRLSSFLSTGKMAPSPS
ncbi:hypothetical protein [Puniceicoccus vermicola]|uniref:Uncharacterized protein n=1 Tax=Puniceicoccus vermicola TaxID=388746 RepID=A0A7X1E5Y4_9BACT|nr:hypothetical protein [Puniceicoccus vermicola]MBC2604130.1 hypothetical protein [Puniceicoccus vermicola]